VKSKLTNKAFLFPLLAVLLGILYANIIADNWPIVFRGLRWIDFYMFILFAFTIIWIAYFQVFRKMVFVDLEHNKVKCTNILGRTSELSFDQLTGYKTSINTSRIGNFEELKVISGDQTVFILSEWYHENYQDMKKDINHKLKYLGGAAKNYS
jgi:hypothetical protein